MRKREIKLYKITSRKELSESEYKQYDNNAKNLYRFYAAALFLFLLSGLSSAFGYFSMILILIGAYFMIENSRLTGHHKDYINATKYDWPTVKHYLKVSLLWFGAIIAILLFVAYFVIPTVSAADTTKWGICGALNLSGGPCDDFWTNFTGQYAPQQQQFNISNQTYTKAEIDAMFKTSNDNITRIWNNLTSTPIVASAAVNTSEFVKMSDFLAFRQGIAENYSRKDEVAAFNNYNSNQKENSNWPLYLMITVAVSLVIGLFFLLHQQNQKNIALMYQSAQGGKSQPRDQKDIMKAVRQMNRKKNNPEQQPTIPVQIPKPQAPPQQEG